MDADDRLLRSGAFVECVFHCVDCGLGGTSLIRPSAIRARSASNAAAVWS